MLPIYNPTTTNRPIYNPTTDIKVKKIKNPVFGEEPDNHLVEPLNLKTGNEPAKSWEQMGFGEKLWRTAKELPSVLYNFIPEAHRKIIEDQPFSLSPAKQLEHTKKVVRFGQFPNSNV